MESEEGPAANLDTVAIDAAAYLEGEEAQTAFLNEALSSGHGATMAQAIGDVARARSRAKGFGELARAIGLARQTLHRALGPTGNPTIDTILPILGALGFRLKVERESAVTSAAGSQKD